MSDKDMREVYTDTLVDMAKTNEDICVLEADLMGATGTKSFKAAYPDRTFDVGVAEANMGGVAPRVPPAGLVPFPASFGCFAARRTYDQFFLSANYAQQNVKLVGTDPGVTAQFNGGTHMPFEDAGIMRNIPGLVVFEPCDTVSLDKLVRKSAEHQGCTYMRLHRKGSYTVYNGDETFELGKGNILREGTDATIMATGLVMVPEALKAAEMLAKKGKEVRVVDMHTIKPIDKELVLESAEKTGAIVTSENHNIINGLGSAVAEVLVENNPVPMIRHGVEDRFGQVGTLDFLQKDYGLTAEVLAEKVEAVIARKKK